MSVGMMFSRVEVFVVVIFISWLFCSMLIVMGMV